MATYARMYAKLVVTSDTRMRLESRHYGTVDWIWYMSGSSKYVIQNEDYDDDDAVTTILWHQSAIIE